MWAESCPHVECDFGSSSLRHSWLAAQQIVEAFPEDTAQRYLVRDRDGVYGHHFIARVEGLGVEDVPISARSPWQNCYAERVIGSIRRECLDHVVVINERHLRRILKSYFQYYKHASSCPTLLCG